jgi:hypothetical protein
LSRRAKPLPTEWVMSPHVCRHCLGRILQKENEFRCSTCGVTSTDAPKGICGCGIKVNGSKGERYHCRPNPDKSFKAPAEYVIFLGDHPAKPVKA